MRKGLFYFIGLGVLLTSCNYFKTKSEEPKKIVAKVNDAFLYEEDIVSILPKEYTKEDSSLLVNNYINSWAKQELLYYNAKLNLKEDQEEISKLVKKYEQDLLINKYKEALIAQELDTVINEKDVDAFYQDNKEIFHLNEKLIKFRFIQIDKEAKDKDAIEKLFKSDKKEDREELVTKELEYKANHFNDSVWVKYSELVKLLPEIKKAENKIYNNSYIKQEDSLDSYMIKIKEVLNRNQMAPKSYVEPTIKQMILHNRKLLLFKEIEKIVLNDATKNGKYEIYK